MKMSNIKLIRATNKIMVTWDEKKTEREMKILEKYKIEKLQERQSIEMITVTLFLVLVHAVYTISFSKVTRPILA